VARLDSSGDVLLTGPAIRAVASGVAKVTMLCGPRGRAAAELLPDVDDLIVHLAGWIDHDPDPISTRSTMELIGRVAGMEIDQAVIFTSLHQSPLPLALLLRMAGVKRISGTSIEYPGSLLDVRHIPAPNRHEVEHQLDLARAAGFALPDGDNGALRTRRLPVRPEALGDFEHYVVVHPGASAPARTWSPTLHRRLVRLLVKSGRRVVVTGSESELNLTARVAGPISPNVLNLGGRLTFGELGEVLAGADVVVVGNTGPAHLASGMGTPIVSLFAPTVPASRWRPWMTDHALLGDQRAACAGSRVRVCQVPGHPCLNSIAPEDVVREIEQLAHLPHTVRYAS
jgi:ADP-heptose:LPS heptosyltransferase